MPCWITVCLHDLLLNRWNVLSSFLLYRNQCTTIREHTHKRGGVIIDTIVKSRRNTVRYEIVINSAVQFGKHHSWFFKHHSLVYDTKSKCILRLGCQRDFAMDEWEFFCYDFMHRCAGIHPLHRVREWYAPYYRVTFSNWITLHPSGAHSFVFRLPFLNCLGVPGSM